MTIKINVIGSGPSATFSYIGGFIPRVGENINWPFAGISGTVSSVEWIHTNEVTITVATK